MMSIWPGSILPTSRSQILPLIENLECLSLFVHHRPLFRRSVGPPVGWSACRLVGGFEDWRMGDLGGIVHLPDSMVDLSDTLHCVKNR